LRSGRLVRGEQCRLVWANADAQLRAVAPGVHDEAWLLEIEAVAIASKSRLSP